MIWMRLYGATLFVHILGVIALFGGLSLQQRAGSQLRRAETLAGARRWAEVMEMSRPMVPAGAVMLLVTGGYLGHVLAGGEVIAWIAAAAADTLLIGVAAVAVLGPDLRAIQAAVAEGEGTLPEAALARIRSARTWGALGAVNGAALGTLWLMVMEPGMVETVLAATLPALAGAAIGSQLGRPHRVRALAGSAPGR